MTAFGILLKILTVCSILGLVGGVVFTVNDDAKNGTLIGNLSCIDASSSTILLSYANDTIMNNSWFHFQKHGDRTFDFLVGEEFHLIGTSLPGLKYKCNRDSIKSQDLQVDIHHVNNNPPVFCNTSSFVLNIPEDTKVKEILRIIPVCDADRNTQFSNQSVKPYDHFSLLVAGHDIKLQLNNPFDYDIMPGHLLNYSLTVEDSSTNASHKSANLQFQVNITDVDDLSPVFTQTLYNCHIPEGVHKNDTVCAVTAIDQDFGLNTTVRYKIISVVPTTHILTVTNTGKIQASGLLDRENISTYSLVVKGFQQDRPDDRYNFTTVVIDITDIDDHPPMMSAREYEESVMENTKNGVVVLQVAATDPDLGDHGSFHFALKPDAHQAFSINTSNGVISVKNSALLDYETTQLLNLSVQAVPKNKQQKPSSWSYVYISLIDENDNEPQFQRQPYNFTIAKNWNISSIIGQVTAKDPDTQTSLSYHLVPQAETVPFAINSQTGNLTVSGILADNYKPVYNLTVMAEDGPSTLPTTRRSTAPITVHVADVNMFSPKFDKGIDGLVLNISEATSVGTNILELNARDRDSMDKLNFTIAAGNKDGHFGLELEQSQIYVKHELDRETTAKYQLTLNVTDGQHTTTANVTINILDENDCDPIFARSLYIFTITEEQSGDILIGNVSAFDKDTGLNGQIQYKLENSIWSNNFTVNPDTGAISTTGKIDREVGPAPVEVVELIVIANDGGSPPRSNRTRVILKVEDINDNMPVFSQTEVNIALSEGYGPGIVYQAKANDIDGANNNVILYRISNSTVVPDYIRVSSNGNVATAKSLQIQQNTDIIHITLEAYNSVRYVQVESQYTGNSQQLIQLRLTDINNHFPVFHDQKLNVSLIEDYPTGQVFHKVSATDADFTAEFNTVTYWLESSDNNFGIDSASGSLYLAKSLDFENKTKHSFRVYASDMHKFSDNNTIVNSSIPVTVVVLDENDNAPEFVTGPYNCSLMEEYSGKIENCSVLAEDKDSGANGRVTYSVIKPQIFSVDEKGNLHVGRPLDYDLSSSQHVYTIQMKASDGGTPHNTAITTVRIHLLNKNDNPPVFNKTSYDFSVPENNTKGQLLFPDMIAAFDLDGDQLHYNVTDKDFRLNNGFLEVTGVLDYEANTLHSFNVTVSDGNTTVEAPVYVHVLPVNEFAPQVILSENPAYVTEGQKRPKSICINGADLDDGADGSLTATLVVPVKWKSFIKCIPVSYPCIGICRITAIDRDIDKSGEIELLVTIHDHGSPQKSTTTTLIVNVTGINDNPPLFTTLSENYTIKEGAAKNHLHTAVATDADIGIGSSVFYRLRDGNSTLFHVAANGTVSIEALWIDESNHGVYQFIIEAYNAEAFENCELCKNALQSIRVILQDVNNHSPEFEKKTDRYVVNISECLQTGSNITRVIAKDQDASLEFNTVSYWLGNDYNKIFRVDSHTGDIYLEKPIDYDPPHRQTNFSLMVYASDVDNMTGNTTVEIAVQDCNDNHPTFNQASYRCKVKENTTETLHCAHSVGATDIDEGSKLTYKILDDPSKCLEINTSSGIIRAAHKLDYETFVHNFSITITATDDGKPPLDSNCTVFVELENINDWSPKFFNLPYNFQLYENTHPNSSSIGEIFVEDKDGDQISVKIQGHNSDFWLSDTLELFPLRSFDYENKAERTIGLTLLASDEVHTSTASITVNILDRNDQTPRFLNESYDTSVLENVNISHAVIQVEAVDDDSYKDGNSNVSYCILEGAEGTFHIDSSTGWITVTKSLNASVRQSYSLIVQASDNGKPRLVNITTVTINVTDINDQPPWFLYTPYTATVRENANASLLKVYGKDPDPGTKALTFSVADTNMSQYFHFEKNTLCVTELDAEILGLSVNVRINLTDDDNVHTVHENVTVTVIDVNDHVPYFEHVPYIKTINDTEKNGSVVLTVEANDKDITGNKLTYTLYGGEGDFIINRTTGLIQVSNNAHFNPDKMPVYDMTVIAQDSGSPPKTNTSTVTIHLHETNAGPPTFKKATYTFMFPENNISISDKVEASDPDGVIYSILSRSDDGRFTLNSASGLIMLTGITPLDYENRSEYSLVIEAKDKAAFPKSSTTNVTIKVVDLNESPHIIINPKNVFKQLNSTPGEEVMQISGTDPDTKPKFKNLTYSQREIGTNYFKTNPNTGSITIKNRLDQAGNFSLTVTVTDAAGLKDDGLVFVFVSDITGESLNTTVYENQTNGTTVYDLQNSNLTELLLEIQKGPGAGNFTMENNTKVVTAEVLDRESNPEFNIIIIGKDIVNKIMKAQIQLHVTVLDINDNPPLFEHQLYDFHIKEEESIGTVVGHVTANDKDLNPKLTYSMVNGPQYFKIDNNGTLTVRKKIDREKLDKSWNDTIQYQIECFDGNFTAIAYVRIKVRDINDNPPKFTQDMYHLSLYENHDLGVLLEPKVAATDEDIINQGKLNYSIIDGNTGGYFSLDTSTGSLKLNKSLDYENTKNFSMQILVSDGIYNDTAILQIKVLDVNDNSPVFQNSSYSFYTAEGPSSKGKKFIVTATDLDRGNNSELSYNISDDDAKRIGSYFRIYSSNTSGVIEVRSELDRDSNLLPHENLTGNAYYTFTIVAKDHGQPQRTGSAKVTVLVTDINDCPPTFSNNNVTEDVQEGTQPGHHIVTMTTTDCDFYKNYTTVIYELHGAGSDHFNISKTGGITLIKPVSLHEGGSFDLKVSAFDGKNTANASLRINIIDTNDHTPQFDNKTYNFEVYENSVPGMVGTVLATDDDFGENGHVKYSITSGDGKSRFGIDPDNGTISLIGQLDREQKESYTLIITATDQAQTDKARSGNCEVTITVLDENDRAPKFHPSSFYTAAIREDAANGIVLDVMPKVNATDEDSGEYGTAGIRFGLIGAGSRLFCIDEHTAAVSLCHGPLDRETEPYYQLQITAIDNNGSSAGHNITAALNISVIDVNDNIPHFIGNYEFSVYENTNSTMSVGQVSVTDKDLPGSNTIRYAIRSGGMGQFYIDPVSGSIHVSGSLDREHLGMYHLNVTVTDGRADHVNWTVVGITILDVNDCPPVFNESVLDVKVYEEQGPMNITTAKAFDADEINTNNSRISFYLKNETDTTALFKISEDGILSTVKSLDREKKSFYKLIVIAKDHGNPQLSGNQTVRVTVLDVNDHAPLFCNETDCTTDYKKKHSAIVEESPLDSVVALLVAKDADIGNNGTVEYSISGNPKVTQIFRINRNTGLMTMAESVTLNYLAALGLILKNETTLEVMVIATDKGTPTPKSSNLTLSVSIMGINDQTPEFKLPVFPFNVSEDFKVGSTIGETGAIVNTSTLYLSYGKVSQIGNENFDIVEHTGEIRLSKKLDREAESYYTFPIFVRDGGSPERTAYSTLHSALPTLSRRNFICVLNMTALSQENIKNFCALSKVNMTASETTVVVYVLDCNDNSPQFLQEKYVFNILENTMWSGAMNISARDRDEGLNAKLAYSLMDDFGGLLSIDNSSGIVTLQRQLDREINETVIFTVHVVDGGTPSLDRNTSVKIQVLDVNDNPPTFYNCPSLVNMTENNIHQSFQVHAKDPDEGLNGTVIFELGTQDPGPFQINPFTGNVSLLEPLDYELVPQYSLTILASDQGQPQWKSTSCRVTLDVIDVYDNVPECKPEIIEKTVKSTVPVYTEIAQVYAGKGALRYRLTGGPSSMFSVDKMNGKITTSKHLGTQTKEYELSVTATDQFDNKTAVCKVIVYIEDSSASLPMPSFNVSIRENLNVTLSPYLLIDLNSTEEQRGDHVSYIINGSDPEVTSKFWVEPTSGRVYCNASLDRETKGVYELFVTVQSTPNRRKRDTKEMLNLDTVKLVVVVEDVNDNPPRFTDDQKQNKIFGVPSTAKANYLVTTLKTSDADVNSRTLYRVIDGDMAVFGVGEQSGEIITLAAVAKNKRKQFDLTVMAIDQDEPTLNDTIALKIYAVNPGEQLMLTANMSITDFTKKSQYLISKMGDILGVKVQLEYSTPHQMPDGSVDLKTTDIFFHGLNSTTNSLISYDIMLDLMKRNEAKLKELFNMRLLEVEKVPVDYYLDPSKVTVSQIALICMAVLIFFGSLIGILLTMYSWQRLEESEETERKEQEKIELESLRSRHSNRPDITNAFSNQTYAETQFGSSPLSKQKKGVQYESQELRMTFDPEGILHNGPVHRDRNGSFSMADSGVENVSLHSSGQNRPGSVSRSTENKAENRNENIGTRIEHTEQNDGRENHKVLTEPLSLGQIQPSQFLNVDYRPFMTSTPYQSHTDVSKPNNTCIVLDQDHNRSETESTTDVLDVDKTIPDTKSHGYESSRGTKEDAGKVNTDEDTTLVKKQQSGIGGGVGHIAGDRSGGSYIEEQAYKQPSSGQTLTLGFEQIGETTDENVSTQF